MPVCSNVDHLGWLLQVNLFSYLKRNKGLPRSALYVFRNVDLGCSPVPLGDLLHILCFFINTGVSVPEMLIRQCIIVDPELYIGPVNHTVCISIRVVGYS